MDYTENKQMVRPKHTIHNFDLVMFKHNQIKIHAFSHATEDNTSATPKHKRVTYRKRE